VTVNGQGLTANIVASAPSGFEVSADGLTYGSTADLVPTSGTVNAATLRIRIAASAAVGSPSGNVTLASTGSQSVSVPVSGTVAANSYNTWAGTYGLNPATDGAPGADPDNDGFNNQLEYGFGTNPTAGNAALLSTSVSGGNMIVTWLQREDAAPGSYNVVTTTDLKTGFTVDTALTSQVVDAPDQTGVPSGYKKKKVTVSTFSSERNFLALAFD
jgi:hypothetical protein